MRCPSCKGEVDDRDWLCPYCEHILDPSVLGVDAQEVDASQIRAERTKLVAWDPRPEEPHPADPPEAMILGEIDVSSREISVVEGPAVGPGGGTSTFLFYTAGATSRIVHPDAVPKLTQTHSAIPNTPYEHFILSCIDGKRSVRNIQKSSGLAPQEVVITLLTLLDKGVISVNIESRKIDDLPPVPTKQLGVDEDEENPTIDGIAAGPRARAIEDRPRVRELDELGPEREAVRDAFSDSSPSGARAVSDPAREELLSKPLYPSTPGRALPTQDVSDDREPVQPQPLDEQDSEMITDHSAAAPVPMPAMPAMPATPATPKREPPPPPKKESAPRPTPPPAPLLLDPNFLVEVPKSEKSEKKPFIPPSISAVSAVKRAPIEERDRRAPVGADSRKKPSSSQEMPKLVLPAADSPTEAPPAPPPPSASAPSKKAARAAEPIDGVRMAKASKLFEEALKDKKEGNFVSARMNMKLALTFDPTNELYQQAFDELAKGAGANAIPSKMKSRAREFYDSATRAEEEGNVDEAIELLEKALHESKEAAYYNRLGVLLAMKKKQFARAQELIETALKISPGNNTYQHNLGKVLSMAATHDVDLRKSDGKKSGILGFLGRKK